MKKFTKQQGFALLLFVTALATAAATLTIKALNNAGQNTQIARDKITATALAQAKNALVGRAVSQSAINSTGQLPLPDIGSGLNYSEGNAAGNFLENGSDYSVIGKTPWKSLDIPPPRDGQGECLWYVVSGHIKNSPKTDIFNWDTPGQIDVIDENNNSVASNVAALLVAPGRTRTGQNRAQSNPVYTSCGGNYDASNYLNSYFTGSTNNRVSLNTDNKAFIMTHNDRFLIVTVDDIFRTVIKRSDFANQITSLLNDTTFITYLQQPSLIVAGNKGTDNVHCKNSDNSINTSTANQTFCTNWLEILLFTKLPSSSAIVIDGVANVNCSRVLIFGGKKTANQVRLTVADKSNPANYLEGANLSSFATPTSASNNFSGASTFLYNTPSVDLLKCIP
jgi:hypothetical protein